MHNEPTAHAREPGSELAGYRIKSVLGEGDTSIVYLAEQPKGVVSEPVYGPGDPLCCPSGATTARFWGWRHGKVRIHHEVTRKYRL